MSRVNLIEGSEPFLIVAPHGATTDDTNTDIVARAMAKDLNGYAVINTGWQRIWKPDVDNSRANLNNIEHCRLKPVKQEFLHPIVDFAKQCIDKHGMCYLYLIHGMSAKVQKKTNDNVHVVVGFGQGKPSCYSCTPEHKDLFIHLLRQYQLNVYQGRRGGKFSAWHKNNLNQLFRKHAFEPRVQSMQLELVSGLRWLEDSALGIGHALAKTAELASWRIGQLPPDFKIMEY